MPCFLKIGNRRCPVRHWLWFWLCCWLGLFVMPSYPLQTHETSWNPNRSSLQRHRKDGAASHDDGDDDDDDGRDAVRMMMKLMIVWQSSACLHDDEIMSAKAFAFIMYNILFRCPSLPPFLYLLFFSFS